MVRKVSITLHDDGSATVEGDIRYVYPSYEKGVEIVQLIVLSLSGNPLNDHRQENLARSTIPSDELKPAPTPEKPEKPVEGKWAAEKKKKTGKPGKGNKFGIPSEIRKTDKKRYDALWARCKSHGIMYEEALKRDGIKGGGRPPKSAAKKTTIQTTTESPEKTSEEVSRIDKPPSDIKIEGADAIIDKMPEEPTASRTEIRQGCRVKQTNGTKIFTGTGTVKRCPQGKTEVLVQFDNGLEWFERKNLTMVEAAP